MKNTINRGVALALSLLTLFAFLLCLLLRFQLRQRITILFKLRLHQAWDFE